MIFKVRKRWEQCGSLRVERRHVVSKLLPLHGHFVSFLNSMFTSSYYNNNNSYNNSYNVITIVRTRVKEECHLIFERTLETDYISIQELGK